MRRGSLIGPLILILIGVVFLLKNIRPDLPLFDMVMTYWPFLLIGWGVIRLVEILVLHFQDKPLPSAGISGGEWAVIIILSVIGSSVWGVQRFTRDGLGKLRIDGVEVFGETYEYPLDAMKAPAEKNARVVVDNPRGNTRVTGSDTAEVVVTGRKTVRSMQKTDADKANDRAKVVLQANGGTVTVSGPQERVDGSRLTSDLEITVPRGAILEIRGKYGDIDVTTVDGEVTINSDNAGVRVEKIGGRVKIDTRKSDIIRAVDVKGDVELRGRGRDIELENIAGEVVVNGSYSGDTSAKGLAKPLRFESSVTDLRVEKIPGELHLSLSTLTGENLGGPLVLKTKSKDVNLTDVSGALELDLNHGDVEIRQTRAPVPRMDVRTGSGNIELAVPANAGFTLNASAERGEVNNDLDQRLKLSGEERGGKLTGSLGPGPEVKLVTSRGSLTVRKVSATETTPAPPAPPAPKKAPAAAPARANDQ
jgi:hypothetical protein